MELIHLKLLLAAHSHLPRHWGLSQNLDLGHTTRVGCIWSVHFTISKISLTAFVSSSVGKREKYDTILQMPYYLQCIPG